MTFQKRALVLLALVLTMLLSRGAAAQPPNPSPTTDVAVSTDKEGPSALARATSREDALKALKTAPTSLPQPAVGQVDLAGALAETLQILGQIVVDRASAKAYTVLQDQLLTLLRCNEGTPTATPAAATPAPATPAPATTRFVATCDAVRALRIEDIAMAPTTLGTALAEDLLAALGIRTDSAIKKLLGGVLAATMPSFVEKPSVLGGSTTQRIVDAILQFLASKTSDFDKATNGQKAVALGALIYAKCLAQIDATHSLASCNVAAIAVQLGGDLDAEIQGVGSEVARRLVTLSASKLDLPKLRLAVDTAFATACLLEAPSSDPVALSCPTIESRTTLDTTTDRLAFAAAFVDAAISTDGARLIVVATKLVDLLDAKAPETAKKYKRALRFLGGLLDYASTYIQATGDDKDAQAKAHDQRTKILESLTRDMSDRTGREGAVIVSLGGSLRLVGGARIGLPTKGATFYGPLSLPLGISIDYVNSVGFHFELDAVDLGNYLSLDDKPTVKTPELGDAFSPSATVGISFGKTLPLVIGVTAGWTPQFAYDAARPDSHGTFNIGATVGIHVPLIDLN